MTAAKPEAQRWFVPLHVCLPCYEGEHDACRHRPDGPRFGRAPEGVPCRCEAEGHTGGRGTCSDTRMSDYDLVRCGKPAKGEVAIHPTFGGPDRPPEVVVERCGVHLAGLRRRAENDARYRAEREARQAERDALTANQRAAEDWCARLAEVGIVATPAATEEGPFVRVDPERLYGQVREAVIEMDAIGIEHRFHPRPEATPDDSEPGGL